MAKRLVGMAEYKIGSPSDTLYILGLGSCVAVAMHHKRTRTGGLVHIMLPEGEIKNGTKPGKYANHGVKKLYEEMIKKTGAGQITAKITGGAQMFKTSQNLNIGEKNILAVKDELEDLGIKMTAQETGKNYGRTIYFTPENNEIIIKTLHGEKRI